MEKRTLVFISMLLFAEWFESSSSSSSSFSFPPPPHYRFITSLRKELREDLLEGIFIDQTAWAFLLEASVD